ncbi:hypothetical protein G6O69_38675 [Pseudenhygromyxa sp. WMMC2535]|uniref:hypothetical protein n=1 Tax=Pseudenhygromyxa sp. WMMC2535 TaxID=2712867 RepID=UPI001554D562|nr:hypothetical protein [Pseudenhygromyxa sp. WMMC2535]NVB43136.1 hypothetical protein [Pseudenhygromyxa sp. WMMC2535]NVB43786.1 hypothetical protein [Pseudenhygromyxa sp. WMMC2535]
MSTLTIECVGLALEGALALGGLEHEQVFAALERAGDVEGQGVVVGREALHVLAQLRAVDAQARGLGGRGARPRAG